MTLSFATLPETDKKALREIVVRAINTGLCLKSDGDELLMDLLAAHENGRPLDFVKLQNAPVMDFIHDVLGIQRELDRTTGALNHWFLPRCALIRKAVMA